MDRKGLRLLLLKGNPFGVTNNNVFENIFYYLEILQIFINIYINIYDFEM